MRKVAQWPAGVLVASSVFASSWASASDVPCTMESYGNVANCPCLNPPPHCCGDCRKMVGDLKASCLGEYERGMARVREAANPADIAERREAPLKAAEVAAAGDIVFDDDEKTGRVNPDAVLVSHIPKPLQVDADITGIAAVLMGNQRTTTGQGEKKQGVQSVDPVTPGIAESILESGRAMVSGAGKFKQSGVPSGAETRRTEDAKTELQKGNSEAAEEKTNQVLAGNPENRGAREVRALARMKQGRADEALSDAEELLRRDPKNQVALDIKAYAESGGRLAGRSLSLKRPDFGDQAGQERGKELAGRAGVLDPGAGLRESQSAGARQAGKAGSGAGWMGDGRTGTRAMASQEARSGAGAGPGAAYPPTAAYRGTLPLSQGQTLSQVCGREAGKKLRMGDLSGAFLEATRAIKADPRHAPAWALRAAVSNKLGKYDAALADATEALKLEPGNVPALLERGFAQYGMANYSAALEDIGAALRLEPMNALGYLYRGMIFEKLSRYSEALSDYETAARLDPTLKQFWEDAKARLPGMTASASGKGGLSTERLAWLAFGAAMLLAATLAAALFRARRGRAAGVRSPGMGGDP